MGIFKVYLKTFDYDGSYETEFTDVSRDVLKLSDIRESLDSTEYNLGIFKLNKLKLSLRNDHGRFTPPPNYKSFFKTKMKDTQVKITWNIRPEPLCVGINFPPGHFGPLGEEIELFRGLLTETSSKGDVENQSIDFDILGFESLLSQVAVPYDDITNGDDISDVMYSILNQTTITDLLTVSLSNITPGLDQAIDDKSDLENKTGREAFGSGESLLLLSQSVLTIQNQTIYISDRDPTASVQYSFYGPSSNLGGENIIQIKDYREGLNQLFNFWTWSDTTLVSQDDSSITSYGVYKKEVGSDLLTNSTKRQNILDDLKTEFSSPKKSMILVAPLTSDTAGLKLLDRVNIDYPNIYRPADDGILPVWGSVKWGSFKWPIGQFSFAITQATEFKILDRKIKTTNETIEFTLREV